VDRYSFHSAGLSNLARSAEMVRFDQHQSQAFARKRTPRVDERRCRPDKRAKGVLHKARVHTQELFCGKKYRLRLRGFFTIYTVVDETGLHSPLSSGDRKLERVRLDSGRHF